MVMVREVTVMVIVRTQTWLAHNQHALATARPSDSSVQTHQTPKLEKYSGKEGWAPANIGQYLNPNSLQISYESQWKFVF